MEFDLLELSAFESADEARQFAIDWQTWAAFQALSYGELAEYHAYFTNLAQRWNLTEEFKENAII